MSNHHESIGEEFLPEETRFILESLGLNYEIRGRQFLAINPNREDNKIGSFTFNLEDGQWKDFAYPEHKGQGLISYCKFVKRINYLEAKAWVQKTLRSNPEIAGHTAQPTVESYPSSEVVSTSNDMILVAPVPPDAPAIDYKLGGGVTGIFEYKDTKGDSMCYIIRIERPGSKKFFSPYTLWRQGDVYEWRHKGLTGLRPLYNLDLLGKNPSKAVLIVEGEKAANVAQSLFPQHIVMTSMSGSGSAHLTDFSPVKDREILLWPDYDEAGTHYANSVCNALEKLHHSKPIKIVSIQKAYAFIHQRSGNKASQLKEGWDLADAVSEGWTAEDIEGLPEELWESNHSHEAEVDTSNDVIDFKKFFVNQEGVFLKGADGPLPISSRILPVAKTRSINKTNWGLLLEITNPDGNKIHWNMRMNLLSGNGEPVRNELLDLGVEINHNQKFTEFLMTAKPDLTMISSEKIGWQDNNTYLLPHKTYGNKSIILDNTSLSLRSPYQIAGSLEHWQATVAKYCLGNSRMILAMCTSLASPFLHVLGEENGGIHFRGKSSSGKSKILEVARSVWGGKEMINAWRTTDNAIESLAIARNDAILILDEMGQVDAKVVGDIAYTLGNGQQKARLNKSAEIKTINTWRLLFMSSGEISLAQHLESVGKKSRAGMEVRMLEIPAEAGAGMGVFEYIHDFKSPSDFVDALDAAAATSYGWAADFLLRYLTEHAGNREKAKAFVEAKQTVFKKEYVGANSDGQVIRAANRFGLIAAVGELCISLGLLPWSVGNAFEGCSVCFRAWLKERGGSGATETLRALQQVRFYIMTYGNSRFTPLMNRFQETGVSDSESQNEVNNENYRSPVRTGYSKEVSGEIEYWIPAENYRQQLCEGLDPKFVTRVLKEHNCLVLDADGATQVNRRLPVSNKQVRFYIIKSSALLALDLGD